MNAQVVDYKYTESITYSPLTINTLYVNGVSKIEGECEVNNTSPDFYSVYISDGQGDILCLSDHDNMDIALDFAYALQKKYGYEIKNNTLKLRQGDKS